jgi:hypothetical protein
MTLLFEGVLLNKFLGSINLKNSSSWSIVLQVCFAEGVYQFLFNTEIAEETKKVFRIVNFIQKVQCIY